MIKYLSPSSIGRFERNAEDFYIHYMTERPRDAQTDAMAAGSAFDAFIKAELLDTDVEPILKSQVEPQWLEQSYNWGEHLLLQYVQLGAYRDLQCDLEVLGEYSVESDITDTVHDVPLRGKPDLVGDNFILDWKVNGYFSKYNKSPEKGFVRLRGLRHSGECHKMVTPMLWNGVMVSNYNLDGVQEDWARQMAIYGWLSKFEVGDEFLIGIDQLVCKPGVPPSIRVAEHRSFLGRDYQIRLMSRIQEIWEIINSDHFFRDMSKDQSQEREATLRRTVDPVLQEFLR